MARRREHVAAQQRRVLQARRRAHADDPAVERRLRAVADDQLVQDGLIDGPEHGLALVEQRDERPEERGCGGECAGAIDRIQHPHEFRTGVFRPEFLAENAMRGEAPADHPPHELLGPAVGHGHRRLVGLGLDDQAGAGETGADEVAARAGKFEQETAVDIEIHGAKLTTKSAKDTKIKAGADRSSIAGARCGRGRRPNTERREIHESARCRGRFVIY